MFHVEHGDSWNPDKTATQKKILSILQREPQAPKFCTCSPGRRTHAPEEKRACRPAFGRLAPPHRRDGSATGENCGGFLDACAGAPHTDTRATIFTACGALRFESYAAPRRPDTAAPGRTVAAFPAWPTGYKSPDDRPQQPQPETAAPPAACPGGT